jgi:hypothetical protein
MRPGPLPGKPKVTLLLHYGATTSVGLGAAIYGSGPPIEHRLVEPVHDTRGDIYRAQGPVFQVEPGVGNFSRANRQMVG